MKTNNIIVKNEYCQTEIDTFGVEYDVTNSVLINAYICDCENYKIREGTIKILHRAFIDNETLQSIEMPDSLEIIEGQAFQNCKLLKSINFNEGLKSIEFFAFNGCDSLEFIWLPASLCHIGKGVFSSCSKIQSFEIDEQNKSLVFNSGILYSINKDVIIAVISSLIKTDICVSEEVKQILKYAFYNCNSLKYIKLPEFLEYICDSAFENCISLQTINLPYGLKSIGKRCFIHSKIETILIPENVEYIGTMAFSACYALEAINVVDTNTYFTSISGVLFSIDNTLLLNYPSVNKQLKYIIPKTVCTISIGAFQSCMYLEKVELPLGLTKIEEYTFSNCRKLVEIIIPNGITQIGEYAFESCGLIEEIKLPDSVNSIKRSAFENCGNLKRINISPELTEIEPHAFFNCNNLKVNVHPLNPRYKSFNGLLFEKCNSLFGLSEFNNETNHPF
ncbi:MAG: leucine-rich repeat domain-containing protein [Paludibacter sp.]